MSKLIPTEIIPSVELCKLTPNQVRAEFRALLDAGAQLKPGGEARHDLATLNRRKYWPQYKLELFGTRFYLTAPRKNPAVRFFVAYVIPAGQIGAKLQIYPRIFYKDLSLVWRAASHLVASDEEFWIGKGEVRIEIIDGYEFEQSVESTTDLPLEMQTALEALNKANKKAPNDDEVLQLVLRNAPRGRIRPYRDFTAPKEAAAANPRNRIHRGKPIATFTRRNDPSSLKFVKGFEPDFRSGVVEVARSSSRLYGGIVRRYRVLSKNQKIQYLFFSAPEHVWIVPPQSTTVELSSFGVRTVDVFAHDDLFVPGYEYHCADEEDDPEEGFSQIPEGFAGPQTEFDPTRADASPWLDRLPVVKEFRRMIGS